MWTFPCRCWSAASAALVASCDQEEEGKSDSPLAHRVHVQTHGGDLAAAVLVKLVATRLTSEAIKKKLVAEITVGQLEKRFPYLRRQKAVKPLITSPRKTETKMHRKPQSVQRFLWDAVRFQTLTKLCMVRGMSSRTSTSSSSPTKGVMSVFQSVSLLRLEQRGRGGKEKHEDVEM